LTAIGTYQYAGVLEEGMMAHVGLRHSVIGVEGDGRTALSQVVGDGDGTGSRLPTDGAAANRFEAHRHSA
jgi:hypothetical protein